MNNFELFHIFVDFLSRSRTFTVQDSSCANFIYVANYNICYRIEIKESTIVILDTSNCTYKYYDLNNQEDIEKMMVMFDVNENILLRNL